MSPRIRRLSSTAFLSVLCACTVGAGLAWACVPRDWGWSPPATPAATPTPGGEAPPVAINVGPGSGDGLSPAESTPSQPLQSEGRQPAKSRAKTPATLPARGRANSQSGASIPSSAPSLAQGGSATQGSGAVAGTASSSRSAGSGRAGNAPGNGAKHANRATAASRAPAPVQATTVGDLWSGFGGKSAALTPSASDPAAPSAGSQLSLGAGLLALGLVGLFGGLAVAGTRRRRSPARGGAAKG